METALELGPGWGNYTLDLAAICREVNWAGISQNVLDFILHTGAEQNMHNQCAVYTKWENFTPDEQYDLVFGYNCF